MNNTWGRAVYFIVLCELAGFVGSLFTFSEIPRWYVTISKPVFSPPNWVFGPVWTLLYALMGIAAWLVWEQLRTERTKKNKKRAWFALQVFGAQLLLNMLWSGIFFGMHNPALAFGEIVLLWIAILVTIKQFWPISRVAAYLLIPYIAWVSFASLLNFSVWQLNSQPQQYGGNMCTEEAKMCPDGSYVGRTGPNCTFAACP